MEKDSSDGGSGSETDSYLNADLGQNVNIG